MMKCHPILVQKNGINERPVHIWFNNFFYKRSVAKLACSNEHDYNTTFL